mmetsp:Transcript_1345/g.4653  ORF Transcript_1345/g.4653 Transcript_1345/m.4653 type:complete len:115 (+) Transcript_1345:1124-1468(+)
MLALRMMSLRAFLSSFVGTKRLRQFFSTRQQHVQFHPPTKQQHLNCQHHFFTLSSFSSSLLYRLSFQSSEFELESARQGTNHSQPLSVLSHTILIGANLFPTIKSYTCLTKSQK